MINSSLHAVISQLDDKVMKCGIKVILPKWVRITNFCTQVKIVTCIVAYTSYCFAFNTVHHYTKYKALNRQSPLFVFALNIGDISQLIIYVVCYHILKLWI